MANCWRNGGFRLTPHGGSWLHENTYTMEVGVRVRTRRSSTNAGSNRFVDQSGSWSMSRPLSHEHCEQQNSCSRVGFSGSNKPAKALNPAYSVPRKLSGIRLKPAVDRKGRAGSSSRRPPDEYNHEEAKNAKGKRTPAFRQFVPEGRAPAGESPHSRRNAILQIRTISTMFGWLTLRGVV
jgi:hypothetical protein